MAYQNRKGIKNKVASRVDIIAAFNKFVTPDEQGQELANIFKNGENGEKIKVMEWVHGRAPQIQILGNQNEQPFKLIIERSNTSIDTSDPKQIA